jgi:glycolate oxidase iron-sulfur subunit
MQTNLSPDLLDEARGAEADRILRSCVHCGFCNATCPTYRILGDELDGPRGRIYLIKQMLEGKGAAEPTRLHLDRCLTCRACETTCPSGVEYGRLLEIGREHLEATLERPRRERMLKRLLLGVLVNPGRVRWALRLSPYVRGLLPRRLLASLPRRRKAAKPRPHWPEPRHARRVLLLGGCVQAATHEAIDAAAARLLDRHGISLVRVPGSGCCGAAAHHLAAPREARALMARNIDAWWPDIKAGAEAVLASSSACGLMLRDYARLLADDPRYAEKAARVSALVRDPSELLAGLPAPARPPGRGVRVAFHAPCSLQHGLRRHTAIERLLEAHGFELAPVADPHLCCGAAGTYSIFQPELSERLRADKVRALERPSPQLIATANIGCLIHLEGEARVPVRHWIELIEDAGRDA